jgi:transposase
VHFGCPPKLTSEQKQLALRLMNEGKSAHAIAEIFHVHGATIHRLALADS